MNALAIMLTPIGHGWAVTLSNGRELVRFTGLGAKRRALRYVENLYARREVGNVRLNSAPDRTPRAVKPTCGAAGG